MKTLKLGLFALCACAFTLTAQDEMFVNGMKSVGSASGELRKMDKKTGAGAVAAAEKIAGVYENMISFWRQRNVEDAVKWSESGKAAAVELASAANTGDDSKAAAALGTLNGTCKQCHDAHRERIAEGKYKIK